MNAKPTPGATKIGGTSVQLVYNGRAIYRLQSLGLAVELTALRQPGRGHFALCNWLWACAVPARWTKPEDLAAALTEAEIQPALDALGEAIDLAIPPDTEPEPKKGSEPSALSPASSSG
jgi:hypothetical protein